MGEGCVRAVFMVECLANNMPNMIGCFNRLRNSPSHRSRRCARRTLGRGARKCRKPAYTNTGDDALSCGCGPPIMNLISPREEESA